MRGAIRLNLCWLQLDLLLVLGISGVFHIFVRKMEEVIYIVVKFCPISSRKIPGKESVLCRILFDAFSSFRPHTVADLV